MYFSAQQYYNYMRNPDHGAGEIRAALGLSSNTRITLAHAKKALNKCKQAIAMRQNVLRTPNNGGTAAYLAKWHRPWNVVPELRNFRPLPGDYGIGVEVELGFVTPEAAQQVAEHVQHWKYITLDFEGGVNPIELTFPPISFSMLNKRSQVIRYLNYLSANLHLVTPPTLGEYSNVTGTHINVSYGAERSVSDRIQTVNAFIKALIGAGSSYSNMNDWRPTDEQRDLAMRCFGRKPYGYGSHADGGNRYIEWKLFHSTIDSKRFLQYVNVAIALSRLCYGRMPLTQEVVRQALEDGYSGRIRKIIKADKAAGGIVSPVVSVSPVNPPLDIAA